MTNREMLSSTDSLSSYRSHLLEPDQVSSLVIEVPSQDRRVSSLKLWVLSPLVKTNIYMTSDRQTEFLRPSEGDFGICQDIFLRPC